MTNDDYLDGHETHDIVDVSMSWGAYEYCDTCKEVVAIFNCEDETPLWVAGDSAADCVHYLGNRLDRGLRPAPKRAPSKPRKNATSGNR